jgi:hypothetical protein
MRITVKAIVVTQRQPVDKFGFGRSYKSANQLPNGDCTDADGYYIEQVFLVPL